MIKKTFPLGSLTLQVSTNGAVFPWSLLLSQFPSARSWSADEPQHTDLYKDPRLFTPHSLKKKIYAFIFGCAGSSLLRGLFSSCHEQGLLCNCYTQASHCSGLSCGRAQTPGTLASAATARGLSSCGSQALEHRLSSCSARVWLLHSMYDPPGSGIEPVSPALAGRFFITEPSGKPHFILKNILFSCIRS